MIPNIRPSLSPLELAGRHFRVAILLALWVLAGLLSPALFAQSEAVTVGVPQSARGGDIETEGAGVPMSRVIRDADPPYEGMFRDVRVGGRLQPRIGPAGEGDVNIRLLRRGVGAITPISRGSRPENAELKFGPLYWDLRSVSASLLYSDNIRLSETDPDDGLIGIMRARSSLTLQLGEGLQLSVLATLVYLPFRGKVGVAGFGIGDPMASFQNQPLFRAQLAYDLRMGEWDILLIDDFRARHNPVGFRYGFDVFDGESFDEEDRAGRYVFRDRTPTGTSRRADRLNFEDEFITARNLAGASISRLLPTVTRFEAGGYRVNYWYYGRRDGAVLPSSRDVLYSALISERESMRFKPFVSYRASRYNDNPWDQRVLGGVVGDVTENINLYADAGVFISGRSDRERFIWRVRLEHLINSLTYHKIQYSRQVVEPDRDLDESIMYLLRRNLGPYLFAEAFGLYSNFNALDHQARGGDEYQAGIRLTSHFGLRTSARVGLLYSHIDYDDPALGKQENWRVRSKIRYRRTEDWEWFLIHQYQNQRSVGRGRSYDENLIMLTLTRRF